MKVLHSICQQIWKTQHPSPLLIATGEAIPLRGLEGVPGLPGARQDEVEVRPSSVAPDPAESRGVPPSTKEPQRPRIGAHPDVRREGREPLPDKAGESTILSQSGGVKGLS